MTGHPVWFDQEKRQAGLAGAVFLLHGLVDVFLMTTPIYFAFWIGMVRRRQGA